MHSPLIALLTVAAGFAWAGVVPSTHHVVHEKRSAHLLHGSSTLVKRERIPPQLMLPVRIGLKQKNIDQGHQWLMDVVEPSSAKYGKFWSSDEVINAFKPDEKSIAQVTQWLTTAGGISKERITHSDNKAWLAFDAPAIVVEQLLHTTLHHYHHVASETVHIGCDEYRVPRDVRSLIDYVTPGVKTIKVTPHLKKRSRRDTRPRSTQFMAISDVVPRQDDELSTCNRSVTPACLRALYKFEQADPSVLVSANNSIGIFEEGDAYDQVDLDLFFTNFTRGAYNIPNGTHPVLDLIDGGVAPTTGRPGGESLLDFELAYPIVYPQTVTLYQTDDINYSGVGVATNTSGIFNTFFDALDGSYCTSCAFGECGNDPMLDPKYPDPLPGGYNGSLQCGVFKPTNVISISYGEQEADLPAYYQQRQCLEFMKLGLQGVSVFVASGDTGVGGYAGSSSPKGCLGPDDKIFSPTHPNSCPYLTNVGGTQIDTNATVYDPETAWSQGSGASVYSSGGGFSNIYPAPDYQQEAIAAYFADHDPGYPYYSFPDPITSNSTPFNHTYEYYPPGTSGLYNRNGRGIPDVSAIATRLAVYVGGRLVGSGGTSASSPLFASLINRIVEDRIRAGKGPLGLINPVLYKNPQVFNDITKGNNPGCGTPGFSAVKGWDPVTGLGSPDFSKLRDLFLSLP